MYFSDKVSFQKLSVAEIASQFRGEATIWNPILIQGWIPSFEGMTVTKILFISKITKFS